MSDVVRVMLFSSDYNSFDSDVFEDDGEVLCGVENPESCESCQ